MKRELKGKMKGKTAAQRRAIFRAAAAGWKKQPKSQSSRIAKAVTRVRSARARIQTSRKSGGNHTGKGGFNTQKLFKLVRIASLLAPAAVQASLPGTIAEKAQKVMIRYTGFNTRDGKFYPQYLAEGYGPFVATSLITALVPKAASFVRGLF